MKLCHAAIHEAAHAVIARRREQRATPIETPIEMHAALTTVLARTTAYSAHSDEEFESHLAEVHAGLDRMARHTWATKGDNKSRH